MTKKKNNKLLSTSINKKTSSLMEDFNSSIDVDQRLIEEDILVTQAHVSALEKLKVISKNETKKIYQGLNGILNDYQKGKIKFSKKNEDIHMNVEYFLHQRIGDIALKIHTGRSRNDQVATDTRLWTKKSAKEIQELIKMVMRSILNQANKHQETIIPGFTHLQIAQPLSLAHHLLAYLEMFKRDLEYFDFSIHGADENVLGSAALAGSNYQLDQNLLNKKLGFSKSKQNSMDGVSDRDFCMYFLHACTMTSIHLGKLASELILWSSNLAGLFDVHSEYSTGSSIMPQKRNPDAAELIRAKPGRIFGNLLSLMTVLKGLPMTYGKDMQEDKEPIIDTAKNIELCILNMEGMIGDIEPIPEKMMEALQKGFPTATDLADYLVKNLKTPFREAHHLTGKIVKLAETKMTSLENLTLENIQSVVPNADLNILEVLKIKN